MRIRKMYQNLLPPRDFSSPLPPSTTAAAAVAPPVSAAGRATEGKEGEAMMAPAAAAHVPGGGCGGQGGRGLHPNLRATNPTPCQPFDSLPWGAATVGGAERVDLPPPRAPLPTWDMLFGCGRGGEVPKQEQDGESGTDVGDRGRRWSTGARGCGGNSTAPRSLGAVVPVAHGEHKMLPSDAAAALAAAGAMAGWNDEEEQFPSKKRRGGYHARGRSFRLQEREEDSVVAEGAETKPRPTNTRRIRTASSTTTAMAATGTALTSAGKGSHGGAATAAGGGDGAGAGAAKRCDDTVVKEEGGNATSALTVTLADGNHGVGNGKKRRSPAVLMEGSRCSRVNGRGWRCCQQTLVGYSLCEHHLGKGRLRSVSSVRCNGRARRKEDVDNEAAPPLPSLLLRQHDQLVLSGDGEDEDEEKPSERRRNKIGTVKARSISSLLHQPHHPTPTTAAAPAPVPAPSPFPSPIPATVQVSAAAPPAHGADAAMA